MADLIRDKVFRASTVPSGPCPCTSVVHWDSGHSSLLAQSNLNIQSLSLCLQPTLLLCSQNSDACCEAPPWACLPASSAGSLSSAQWSLPMSDSPSFPGWGPDPLPPLSPDLAESWVHSRAQPYAAGPKDFLVNEQDGSPGNRNLGSSRWTGQSGVFSGACVCWP